MKLLPLFPCVALLVSAAACTTVPARPDASSLAGTWTVDLRPKPQDPPYLKRLVVTRVDANRFEGEFYDTPITQGRINTGWGTVRIAFVTADGTGEYHHSAVMTADGRLEGLTNATTRNFLAYWVATRP